MPGGGSWHTVWAEAGVRVCPSSIVTARLTRLPLPARSPRRIAKENMPPSKPTVRDAPPGTFSLNRSMSARVTAATFWLPSSGSMWHDTLEGWPEGRKRTSILNRPGLPLRGGHWRRSGAPRPTFCVALKGVAGATWENGKPAGRPAQGTGARGSRRRAPGGRARSTKTRPPGSKARGLPRRRPERQLSPSSIGGSVLFAPSVQSARRPALEVS